MDGIQPVSMDELEDYCEETFSTLLYLQLETLGVKHVEADHIASHVGKAVGLATLLRALPQQLAARELNFPQQLMAKHALSSERLLRCATAPPDDDTAPRIVECVFEIASHAVAHLRHAREIASGAPQASHHVFRAAVCELFSSFSASMTYCSFAQVPAQLYLDRLEAAQFDALGAADRLQQRQFALYYRLWRARWRRDW